MIENNVTIISEKLKSQTKYAFSPATPWFGWLSLLPRADMPVSEGAQPHHSAQKGVSQVSN